MTFCIPFIFWGIVLLLLGLFKILRPITLLSGAILVLFGAIGALIGVC